MKTFYHIALAGESQMNARNFVCIIFSLCDLSVILSPS